MTKINWFFGYGLGGGVAIVDPGSGSNGSGGETSFTPIFTASDYLLHLAFEELSGTRTDEITQAQFTENGTVTSIAGKVSNGASFNGNTGNFLLSTNSPSLLQDPVSYSVWFKVNGFTTGGMNIFARDDISSSRYFNLSWSDFGGANNLKLLVGNGSTFDNPVITNNGTITLGNWHHLVIVLTGNTITSYVDGVLEITDTVSVAYGDASATNDIYIGDRIQTNPRPFNGLIDELSVFNKALSQSEITDIYNSGNGRSYTELTGDNV